MASKPKPRYHAGQVVMVKFYKTPWMPSIFRRQESDGRIGTGKTAVFFPAHVRPLTAREIGPGWVRKEVKP